MTAPTTALVLGEALIDIVRRGSHEADHAGGSPMNVAVGLSRLGVPTTLATWIGRDERGQLIRKHCADSDVHLVPGSDRAERTPTALATIDDSGSAKYTFDLSWELPPIPKWLHPTVVHTGSIAAVLEPGGDAVLEAVKAAAPSSTITYDPNARPAIIGPAETAGLRIDELVRLADVVKVSDEDLAYLAPDRDALEAAAGWLEGGPAIVVVTRGAEGSVALTGTGLWVEAPPRAAVVVDTVGAGDAFMSGLIWGLDKAGLLGADRREALRGIGETRLREVLEVATRVASITVGRAGANPPRLAELQ
ncbi:MAG: carbohydrate kinase [Bifidobacteriaceae bacterium]|jgi:fructokinase|nr:carbohydrate kinase [Bifidobacteriaceae bacterium]